MNIYCLSGLGADHTVFDRLEFNGEKICINWIPSFKWESLNAYAGRLCDQIDISQPFILLGVSFGGMLAVEMNKFISPEKTILVSSVATPYEMSTWMRIGRKVSLHRYMPSFMFASNASLLIWYFGVQSEDAKQLIRTICDKSDNYFTKLSIDKIMNWDNEIVPDNLVRIHGEMDRLIPKPNGKKFLSLGQLGHFAIVENHEKVSGYVNSILLEMNNPAN